jgi:hypothetical protein
VLGEAAARSETITITCRKCPRHGMQHTARLMHDHGPQIGMPDLLRALAAGCPKLDNANITDRCDVHCSGLPRLFLPGTVSPLG